MRPWGLSAAEQDEVWRRWREGQSLRPTYQISLAGREAAEVRKHFFTPFGGPVHHRCPQS